MVIAYRTGHRSRLIGIKHIYCLRTFQKRLKNRHFLDAFRRKKNCENDTFSKLVRVQELRYNFNGSVASLAVQRAEVAQ
jgi:hypothetical protein